MLGRSLKMAFWILYDHLGKLVVASLIWSIAIVIPLWPALVSLVSDDTSFQVFVGIPCASIAFGIVFPVVTAGMAHLMKTLIDKRDGSLTDFFRGIALYWSRAVRLGLLTFFMIVCLATSVWFYAAKLGSAVPWLGYAVSGLALWCLALLVFTSLLVIPALVQKKSGILETIKVAALLALANPLLTLGLALHCLALLLITVTVLPLFFIIYGAAWVALVSSAYELLARKYAIMQLAAQSAGVGAAPGGAQIMDDADDDYLNRGFRDFLFPWKG